MLDPLFFILSWITQTNKERGVVMTLSILFILSLILSVDLRAMARKLWNNAPTYFFHDAATAES